MFYRWNNLPSCKYFCTHLIPEDLQKLSSVVLFGTPCCRDIYAATGRLLEQEIFYRKFYTLMSGVEIYNLFYNTVAKHEHVRRIVPSPTVNIYIVHNYVYQKPSAQYKLLCTGKGQRSTLLTFTLLKLTAYFNYKPLAYNCAIAVQFRIVPLL